MSTEVWRTSSYTGANGDCVAVRVMKRHDAEDGDE
jgi:hypothetical protein